MYSPKFFSENTGLTKDQVLKVGVSRGLLDISKLKKRKELNLEIMVEVPQKRVNEGKLNISYQNKIQDFLFLRFFERNPNDLGIIIFFLLILI